MPIKPENKKLYPPNWKEISKYIRFTRAGGKCEMCGVINYAVGYRNSKGDFVPVQGNIDLDLAGHGLTFPSLEKLKYKQAYQIAKNLNQIQKEKHYIVIVLTVAHLNHDPTNNKKNNLKALCQKCHNNHDKEHRLNNRKKCKQKR